MAEVTIREACIEDCEEIFRLSIELFEFENIVHNFKGTINSFRQDGFGNKRRFACVVAEDPLISKSDCPRLVGFALYTWLYRAGQCGHVMHIEELYITEKYRRKGIGSALIEKTLQLASQQKLLGVQLVVRHDNVPAMDFYKKLGAVNASDSLGWRMVKLFEDKVKEHEERLEKSQAAGPQSSEDGMSSVTGVRNACVGDCAEIYRLMKELTLHRGETERFKTDVESLRRNGFGEEKNFQCIVVEDKDSSKPGENKLVGYLLYTQIYKAWLGCTVMNIEDLYVSEEYRRKGRGTMLFEEAIKATRLNGFQSIQFTVRQRSMSARNFFEKFGAVDVTEKRGMNFMIFENL